MQLSELVTSSVRLFLIPRSVCVFPLRSQRESLYERTWLWTWTEERVHEAMTTNRPVKKKRAVRMPSAIKAL